MTTAVAVSMTRADVLWDTYARLGDVLGPLVRLSPQLRVDGEPVTGERLVQDEPLRERLVEAAQRRIADDHGVTPRRDVAAMDVLHRYAFFATVSMSGPWFLERRVPWVGLDGIAYNEESSSLAVSPARVDCLPDDPVAGSPGTRVVADEERLRRELRGAVAAHLQPVLEAFRPLMRRGPRAMWGLATDELVEGLWYVGRVVGEEKQAVRAAEELLPGGTSPFVGATGFRSCGDGGGETTRTRINCCLWYTVTPQKPCATCPRRTRP
ncbi:hypothetical protein [Actinomadura kijaniata]|uniref:hypothetical protein n=1 Tax=Actinomadura kijaniata TaxID=46161 RepID=UPI000A076120|nr:hypothetical protein [Actinomadura kijaniata]